MPSARLTLRDRLAGGTTRDLGCTNEVVSEALHSPALLEELVAIRARGRKLLKQIKSS